MVDRAASAVADCVTAGRIGCRIVRIRQSDMRVPPEKRQLRPRAIVLEAASQIIGVLSHDRPGFVVRDVRSQRSSGNRIVVGAFQVNGAIFLGVDRVEREALIGAANVEAVAVAVKAGAVAAGRIHGPGMHRSVLIDVLYRIIPACCFRAARAAIRAGIAQKREGVGERQRIVGGNAVELERLLPAAGQCAIGWVANAAIAHAVDRLAATAAVGVGGLVAVRYAGVLDKGAATVGEFECRRIEAGVDLADGGEAIAQLFLGLHADLGLLQGVRGKG